MTAFARLGDDLSVQAHPATYHPPTQHSYRRALSACLPQTRGPAGSQALTSVLFQDHRLATPQRPGIQTGMQALGGMCEGHCLELSTFEAFHAGGLAPGWNLLVQGHSDSGEDQFEINFLSETGDIVFHIKPRFSSATMVANTFQGGRWGQEEVSSVFPLVLGEPFEMEVSSDAEHFHVHAQEHKVLQFAHRHRPLAAITRVQVLSDHRLAQVELARKGLSWGAGGY
ncbi:grifin isoform X1 [Cervus canadensis]|uniref:grifin isoform X1 n=2 Tax=Cervus canadensis TaxID=1574408 RepID=UPI001CA3396F|nr:grifin isoform X1 [Cervus canadensis]